MDTATAARAIAGTLSGANVDFSRVTTDSRRLQLSNVAPQRRSSLQIVPKRSPVASQAAFSLSPIRSSR